jgi:hypothetical protein
MMDALFIYLSFCSLWRVQYPRSFVQYHIFSHLIRFLIDRFHSPSTLELIDAVTSLENVERLRANFSTSYRFNQLQPLSAPLSPSSATHLSPPTIDDPREMAAESYVVIGGEGFVGSALVQSLLLTSPLSSVASLGLTQRYFPSSASKYSFRKTDITSYSSVLASVSSLSPPPTCLFHTASPHAGSSKESCEAVNVVGTRNIIRAAIEVGVKVLVFTSSVTVCYEGVDLRGCDERLEMVKEEGEDYYVCSKVS